MTKRQIIFLPVLTLVFFLLAQIEYTNIYRLTLYTIKELSTVPIKFYGKFPFLFGDTRFSLIISSIPLLAFLTSKILRRPKPTWVISYLPYVIYFICCYIVVCFWTGLSFHSLNDFYHGETLELNLKEVKINEVFLATIISATTLTAVTLLFVNLFNWARRKILRKQNIV